MPRLVGNLNQPVQNHQTICLVTRLCCTKVQEPICVGSQPFGSPKIDNDRRCQQSQISGSDTYCYKCTRMYTGSDTYCYKVYTDVYKQLVFNTQSASRRFIRGKRHLYWPSTKSKIGLTANIREKKKEEEEEKKQL